MLRRAISPLLLAGALVALTGCPTATESATPQSLRLSFNVQPASAPKVGERRGFTVSFGPRGDQLMSALIATEAGPSLTKWHADPADAVEFEPGGAAAVFKRSGRVKVWATVTDADGRVVESNHLEVEVGD
ncbi:MAG: hypothetical protein M9894_20165 [Planctomycetes bacterium]|nr:hypothetical protein [Planctomycetota bacterium]